MPTTRLDVTAVHARDGGSTVYGNVWNDGSDATYAPVPTTPLSAQGSLDLYAGGVITGISFHVRASATGTTSLPIMVQLDRANGSRVLWPFGGSGAGNTGEIDSVLIDWLIPNDGTIRDYTVAVDDEMLTFNGWDAGGIDELRADLSTTGCALYLWPDPGSTTGTGTVLVYEAWVEIQSAGSPPLRRYPPINNGGSGPTRHYPRAVNRRAGGTY